MHDYSIVLLVYNYSIVMKSTFITSRNSIDICIYNYVHMYKSLKVR